MPDEHKKTFKKRSIPYRTADGDCNIAECYKSGESISELSRRYADGDIRIQLSERTTGNIQYLDITASDDENTYITITSARRVAS